MSLRHRFVLALALSFLVALAGCGSSSTTPVPPPGGGFTKGDLKGTYVISTSGFDSVNGFLIATAGTITADGNGTFTAGTLDVNDADPSLGGQLFGQPITSGSYNVSADGRGTATINTTLGAFGFAFVLTSDAHGLITQFDQNGSGSGTLDLQTPITQSQLSSYAFTFIGFDSGANILGTGGAFSLDSGGTVTGGVQDFNDGGTVYSALPVTGNMVLGADGGSGTATISTGTFGVLTFDFYVIDSTHLKLIETDLLPAPVVSGDMFAQAALPAGTEVFTLGGYNTNGPIAAAGFMNAGGANITNNGTEDVNDAGTVSPNPASFTFTYPALTSGRTTLTLANFVGGPAVLRAYPTTGGLLLMEADAFGVTIGTAFPQTSTALATPPQGYGLNFTGFNLGAGFGIDVIAEFVTSSGGTMTGLLDENDQGSPLNPQTITSSSTFTQDTPVTGRGIFNLNSGSNVLFDGVFYTVDGANSIFIETDTNQVAFGVFQQQAGTTSAQAMSRPLTIVKIPALRPSLRHFKGLKKKN
jgi:hypothetical protein